MKFLFLAIAVAGGLSLAACTPVDDVGPSPMPRLDAPDQCMASRYQRYLGRNRSELPPRPANETWRVTCTTCPMTLDYVSDRLNILHDRTSGVIQEVKCG